ncbi:TRAP transporter small permease [Roseibium salinum]|uniref:TRAP transporter small permease protein n=1 Tax=Roseibium salinum TaxID=1604349 RepID=A0ABT3QXF3_9HYPH|nr:TRAP transporter small permease subunit [Roseibium sp. DSM 29163]MCX2721531.1 TRAP transporter small permease subunit [Roseibium sp. DSM 29163]
MSDIIRLLYRLCEAVVALFMFLMFATFIVQVAIRYGARLDALTGALPFLDPGYYGWTLEFCLALWVWLIFWGNAFVVRRHEHVTFDLLAQSVPFPVARAFLVITGLVIGIGLLASVEPTWSRFKILRIKQTATLGDVFGDWIRMRDVYVIYIVFLVAVGLRALWSAVRALRGDGAGLTTGSGERGPE